MTEQQQIRTLFAQGWSVSGIAAELHVDRKTVRRYLRQEDFSEPFPQARPRPSKLDPFKPTIDAWLAEDARVRYKQRHTAQRVHERLQALYPDTYDCSYSVVQRYLKARRQAVPVQGTLALVWEPGVAQVDFGEADAYGPEDLSQLRSVKYLTLSFPFSNAAVCYYVPGETAECVVQALQDVFVWLSGVPTRVIFDNATAIGRRVEGGIRYAALFERFQTHYCRISLSLATVFSRSLAGS